jgi:hypothetical protein
MLQGRLKFKRQLYIHFRKDGMKNTNDKSLFTGYLQCVGLLYCGGSRQLMRQNAS